MSVTRSLQITGSLITPVTVSPSPLLDDVTNRDTTTGYTQAIPAHFPHVSTNFAPFIGFSALTCVDRVEFVFTSTTTLIPEFWTRVDQDILISGPGVSCFDVAGLSQIFPANATGFFQILAGGSVGLLIVTFDPTPVGRLTGIVGLSSFNGVTINVTDFRVYRGGFEVLAAGGNCSIPGEGNDPDGNPQGTVPAAPVLSGVATCCGTIHTLTWNAVTGATGYRLYDGAALIYQGAGTTFTYHPTEAEQAQTLTYSAIAYNGFGDSAAGVVMVRAFWESSEDCSASWTQAEDCSATWVVDGCA